MYMYLYMIVQIKVNTTNSVHSPGCGHTVAKSGQQLPRLLHAGWQRHCRPVRVRERHLSSASGSVVRRQQAGRSRNRRLQVLGNDAVEELL